MKPCDFGEMIPRVTIHHVARVIGTVAMVVAVMQTAQGQVNPDPRLPPKPYPPAPRLADGTPNLGPTEPNKGYWHLTQFQDYKQVLLHPKEIPVSAVGESDRDAASRRAVEVRPAGLLHAAVRTAADDHAVPDGCRPEQKRIVMMYDGGVRHPAEHLHLDGRNQPRARVPWYSRRGLDYSVGLERRLPRR